MKSITEFELISTILRDSLDDKSWKTALPYYNIEDTFQYTHLYNTYCGYVYDNEFHLDPIEQAVESLIQAKWPSFNLTLDASVYYLGDNVFRLPHSHTEKQLHEWLRRVKNVIIESKEFPFPHLVPSTLTSILKIKTGIRIMAHDLYQPMLLQHRTNPTSFRDRTVGIMRQCPTMFYDDPAKAFSYYPVDFLVCMPYFTMPRDITWLDVDKKMSLADIFLPTHLGPQARSLSYTIIKTAINVLYSNNDTLKEVATKCFNRFTLVHGGISGMTVPDNYAEFLLARDKARREVQKLGPNFIHMMNIHEASTEASRREIEDRESEIKNKMTKLVEAAKAVHIEEFGV